MGREWCCWLVTAVVASGGAAQATMELEQLQVVFRHGDRSAIAPIPALKAAAWPQGPGQLSEIGMQQHFAVGKLYRQKYLASSNLTGPVYDCYEVHVRSTDVDRTLMSGSSQLATWFPTSDTSPVPSASLRWRPIPMHTVPKQMDSILRPFDEGSCPRYTALRAEHAQRKSYLDKGAAPAPSSLCAAANVTGPCTNGRLVEAVGLLGKIDEPFSIDDLWKIADTLFCRRVHGKELPRWATNEMVEYLYDLSGWSMYQMFAGAAERRLTAGVLIKQLVQNANDRLDAKGTDITGVDCQNIPGGSKKLVLYSAHDTTVAMLMMGLDQNHFGFQSQPPYASAILIELWTNASIKDPISRRRSAQLIFKFQKSTTLLSDETLRLEELSIPRCEAPCTLDRFGQNFQSILPDDWEAECKVNTPSTPKRTADKKGFTTGTTVAMVVGALVLLAVALLWCRELQRRCRRQEEYLLNGAGKSPFQLEDEEDEDY